MRRGALRRPASRGARARRPRTRRPFRGTRGKNSPSGKETVARPVLFMPIREGSVEVAEDGRDGTGESKLFMTGLHSGGPVWDNSSGGAGRFRQGKRGRPARTSLRGISGQGGPRTR